MVNKEKIKRSIKTCNRGGLSKSAERLTLQKGRTMVLKIVKEPVSEQPAPIINLQQ